MKILLVEDDKIIASGLEYSLKQEGFDTMVCYDISSAKGVIEDNKFNLCLFDLSLPDGSGYELCKLVREKDDTPVIFLTACDDEVNVVMGLDIGADDYITKPFAIEELLARIRVTFKHKRVTPDKSGIIEIGKLKLNVSKYLTTYDDEVVELTKTEFDLLKYLMVNKNIVLSRENILEKVWGYDYTGDTNVVDVYIRYLRSKIDDRFNHKFIYTVRGVGYQLKDE